MDQLIPKSCLQTYVENALKHGITPLKHSGEIKITIAKQEKNLEIKVRDNGVGRANSSKTSSQSTGRGLKIMHQYYELFNKANKENISEEFIDLTDSEGNPTGTEVIIRIPDDFRFSLSSVSNK
jgi:LytS/YehU family sensor histidine kinase